MGLPEEAEPLFEQALRRRRDFYDDRHPYLLMTLQSLVSLYVSQERYEEADPLARELVAKTSPGDPALETREQLLESIEFALADEAASGRNSGTDG